MTRKGLADYVRFRTKTDTVSFTNAEILLLANLEIIELAKKIIKVNEDYFGVPATANLVANQREYPFPSDMLSQIKYVEAKLDGTNFLYLREFDLGEYERPTNETEITYQFSNDEGCAYYDIFRGSLWIYSGTITSVTSGLKLWYISFPAELADVTDDTTDMSVDPSTTTHGFPKQFHELLGRRIAIKYKMSGDKQIPLAYDELPEVIYHDMEEALDSIRNMNLSREIKAKLPDASTRGDEGYLY